MDYEFQYILPTSTSKDLKKDFQSLQRYSIHRKLKKVTKDLADMEIIKGITALSLSWKSRIFNMQCRLSGFVSVFGDFSLRSMMVVYHEMIIPQTLGGEGLLYKYTG